MSVSTIMVSTILLLIILRIIVSIYRDHKVGGCSSNCTSCGSQSSTLCKNNLVKEYHNDQQV